MVARRVLTAGTWLACACAATACEKVPLVAPTGSTITLTSSSVVLSANGTATVTATVLEAAGTPPHSGTRIAFSTTLGKVEPAVTETDAAGVATVTFAAGGANGTAVVSAISGAATTGTDGALRIALGSAGAGRIFLNASPSTVPSAGGTVTIHSMVLDVNGNPLSATPVVFGTNAGSLSTSLVLTDTNGSAATTLTTAQPATVTASVGVATSSSGATAPDNGAPHTASIHVGVTAAPVISITPPTGPISRGLPATFTFVVTPAPQNGAAIKSVMVNWGDGSSESLGSISASQAVTHLFRNAGPFTVSATVTDVAGGTNSVSTTVVVVPVPRPTIIVTYSPVPAKVNAATTINVHITVPAGIGITSTTIDFGDGAVANLGGAVSASQQHVYTAARTYTITVTVTDTSGQTTVGSSAIAVGL